MLIKLRELRRIVAEEACALDEARSKAAPKKRVPANVWTGKGPSPAQKAFGIGRKPANPTHAAYSKARRSGMNKADAEKADLNDLNEDVGWQAFVDSVDTLREACSAAIAAGTGVAPKYLQALRNIEADLHELRAELE